MAQLENEEIKLIIQFHKFTFIYTLYLLILRHSEIFTLAH